MIDLEVGSRVYGRRWILTYQDMRAGTCRTCPACQPGWALTREVGEAFPICKGMI